MGFLSIWENNIIALTEERASLFSSEIWRRKKGESINSNCMASLFMDGNGNIKSLM
jgi:hypothetical protein